MRLSVEVLVDGHSGDFGREFAQSSGAAVDGALHLDEINVAQSGGLSVGRHGVADLEPGLAGFGRRFQIVAARVVDVPPFERVV